MIGPIEGWFGCINKYTILGSIEGWFEFTSLGISEWASESQMNFFGTNNINKEGDKLWTEVESTDLISYGKILCNDYVNT